MGHIYFPPVNKTSSQAPVTRVQVCPLPGPGQLSTPWSTARDTERLTPLHTCPSRHSDSGHCPSGDPERGHSPSALCFQAGPAHRMERATNVGRVFPSSPLVLGDSREAMARGQRKNGMWHGGAIEPLASFGRKNHQGFRGLEEDVSLKWGGPGAQRLRGGSGRVWPPGGSRRVPALLCLCRIHVTVLAVTVCRSLWVVTSGRNSVKDAWDVAVCSFVQIHENLQLYLKKNV